MYKTVFQRWCGMKIVKVVLILFMLGTNVLFLSDNIDAYYNLTALEDAYEKYQKIALYGGWPTIPEGDNLKKGDQSERVALLRERLIITGDLLEIKRKDPSVFDESLEKALKRFQRRHGLAANGVVDKKTLEVLNLSIKNKIKIIKENIKEMSEYPSNLGKKYVIVNIPDFKVKLIEDNKNVLEMKAIVGKRNKPTPVFSEEISYLVFNPTWIIPYDTALRTYIPAVKIDPDYFSKQNIKVYKRGKEIDPSKVNWDKINLKNMSYKLEQEPGPDNPMGLVKFKFPNKYNVYLHDTPDDYLFKKRVRTFSLGCVRLERPIKLAEYLLEETPGWTPEKIREKIESAQTYYVTLHKPVPVYLVYWTVWVDEKGRLHFRDDIYNYYKK